MLVLFHQTMPEKNICINCNSEAPGEYCHHCGQHQTVKPLTWKELILEFSSKWMGWDNKFLRTIRYLTINPGIVARLYIAGNRVRFIGPLGYLFLISTIMVLFVEISDLDMEAYLRSSQEVMGVDQKPSTDQQLKLTNKIMKWVSDHFRLLTIAMIPFLAIWAKLLYRKPGFNFIEHCVIFIYSTGHAIWFTIVSFIFFRIGWRDSTMIFSLFGIAYHSFAVISFYQIRQKFIGVLKAILLWILAYFTFILLAMVFGALFAILFIE